MDEKINEFRRDFEELSRLWRELAARVFESGNAPNAESRNGLAVLIRSAAAVEQSFGGINAQLWDDPFEWTLPESMDSPAKVAEYFDEVDSARSQGFLRFLSDEDLEREIWTPAGPKAIASLLAETADRARGLADASSSILDSLPGGR